MKVKITVLIFFLAGPRKHCANAQNSCLKELQNAAIVKQEQIFEHTYTELSV